MDVKAKFKGATGSLNYINGENYLLYFRMDSERGESFIYIQEIASQSHGGALTRLRKGGDCKYASLKKFLDNWEVI